MQLDQDKKPIGYEQAFEESVFGGRIYTRLSDAYLVGKHGWFPIGHTAGENRIVVGRDDIVKKYDRLIKDIAIEQGYRIMQKVMTE